MTLLKNMVATIILSIFIGTSMSISASVEAKKVGNVEIVQSITFNDKNLQVQGTGVRSKFFIDLYVASFFNEEKVNDKALTITDSLQIVASEKLSAIRLNIVSGLISSAKMLDSIEQGFELATDGDSTAIDMYITEFISVFEQPIEKKDQFTFIGEPGIGVHVLKNNQRLTSINNDAFRQALFSIWLGDSPVDSDLKAEMLGE